MIANQKKTYKDQLRLTIWFAAITAVCAALIAASYTWIHSVLLLAIGIMFGPIFALLTLVFGVLALVNRLSLRK